MTSFRQIDANRRNARKSTRSTAETVIFARAEKSHHRNTMEVRRTISKGKVSFAAVMGDGTVPDGYLRLSDAVERLARGFWGGLQRPKPLQTMDPKYRRMVSLGFGPWKTEAESILKTAATEGKLPVYVSTESCAAINDLESQRTLLPTTVLSRMIPRRGGLPDHTIRPSLKIACGDQKILELLQVGLLLVQAKDFNEWYLVERAKGNWPSQRSKKERREGRPSKQSEGLGNAVINFMHEKKTSIARLRGRLVSSGRTDVPSLDTLRRLVDRLYRETGDPVLRRMRYSRQRRVKG
jgi:hypothetical protein